VVGVASILLAIVAALGLVFVVWTFSKPNVQSLRRSIDNRRYLKALRRRDPEDDA
jgi:hypothetical protein